MSENLNTVLPNAQNPTLLPNFSQYSSAGLVSIAQSPAQRLLATPRVAASDVGTLTTDPTDADVLTLTVSNPVLPSGSFSVSITAASDTVITAAAKLASAITSSLVAMAYQIYGTSVGDDTFTVNELGPVGNYSTLSFGSTGSTTCAFASSGVMSGGSGPVIPFLNFNSSQGLVNLKFAQGNVYDLAPATVADLVQSGSPVM